MATFHLSTSTRLASANRGGGHADYIAGQGYYAHKSEVVAFKDKNLPEFAKDFKELLLASDKNERANGRSYRTLKIAIPHEAADKQKWLEDFAEKLLGEKVAYRVAFHNDPKNPHGHLSFVERQNTLDSNGFEPWKYFSRQNPKDPIFNKKDWLVGAKELYLAHIRTVAPDYTPALDGKEIQIGPKLAKAGASYEAKRREREKSVYEHRSKQAELKTAQKTLALEIKAEASTRKPTAIAPAKPIPIKTKQQGFSLFNLFKNPKSQPSLKPPKPNHWKTPAQDIKRKDDEFWQAPKPTMNKTQQFLEDMKHDGVFIAHLKSQAPRGDAVIGVIVDSLRRLQASSEFSKQLDEKYKKVRAAGFKDKTVDESKDPLYACNQYCAKEMNKYVNDVLSQSVEADRQRKIREQAPQPEQHPEPAPNRNRPSLKPKGYEMELGD